MADEDESWRIVFRSLDIRDLVAVLRTVFPSLPTHEEWRVPSQRKTFAGHIIRLEEAGWYVRATVDLVGGGAELARDELGHALNAGGFDWELG